MLKKPRPLQGLSASLLAAAFLCLSALPAAAQGIDFEVRGSSWKIAGAELFPFAGAGDSLGRPNANLGELDRRRIGGRVRFGTPSGGLFLAYLDEKITIDDSPSQGMLFRGDGWGLGVNGELPVSAGAFFLYEAAWNRVEHRGDANVYDPGTGNFQEQRFSRWTYKELQARAGIGLLGEISPSLGVVYSDITGDVKTDGLPVASRLETEAAAAYIAFEGAATQGVFYRLEWLFGKTSKKDNLEGLTLSIGGRF